MTWIGIIIQIVTVFFGLGIVTTYVRSLTLGGWVGVKEKAQVSYCNLLAYQLLSDTYMREGSSLMLLNESLKEGYYDVLDYYKNYVELAGDEPLLQSKYTPYGINLGSDYVVFSNKMIMSVAPIAKFLKLRGRPRGRHLCKFYFFSPAGTTGVAEVSYGK